MVRAAWRATVYEVLKSWTGGGNGNPLQYSCLGNPMNRGAWQATVYGFSSIRHDWATKPSTVHFCCHSVTKLCRALCDPMDCSTPGSPVLHHLPEFAQIYVHWVRDAIQPSHPLSSPSPFAFSLSQHLSLFKWVQWVGSLHQHQSVGASASVLSVNIQSWFRLGLKADSSLIWSPCSLRDSRESSPAPQFENINYSGLSLHYGPVLTSAGNYSDLGFGSVDLHQQLLAPFSCEINARMEGAWIAYALKDTLCLEVCLLLLNISLIFKRNYNGNFSNEQASM